MSEIFQEFYSLQENKKLQAVMPDGVLLTYSYSLKAYELRVRPAGMRSTRVLRAIPRDEVMRWREPRLVLNYAARRALAEAGYAAELRVR